MFDELVEKFGVAVKRLRSKGKLTEKTIAESMREIRRVLLEADVNYKVAGEFIASVKEKSIGRDVLKSITPGQQVVKIVYDEMRKLLGERQVSINLSGSPSVIMIAGLQGSGKTTFAGKLGVYLKKKKRYPLLVAADVVRPAAVEQLKTVGKSADLPVFSIKGASAVKIAKKAVIEAKKNSYDTVILDTAGRLHIDEEMMLELEQMKNSVQPSEILYVADSMTGQDAVKSAESFLRSLDYNGIVLTKLDGDAKGGAAMSIRAVTGRPVKFSSIGEKLEDLELFHPDRVASRILGMGDVVSLVEKAQDVVDKDKVEKLSKKLKKRSFNLDDFSEQLQQVKKMGPLSQIAGMLPGVAGKMGNLQVDDEAFKNIEAIINSMTVEEKQNPQIINGSRRKRIAMGSGTKVQEVNQLLNQFKMMKKMIKGMGRHGSMRLPGGMPVGF